MRISLRLLFYIIYRHHIPKSHQELKFLVQVTNSNQLLVTFRSVMSIGVFLLRRKTPRFIEANMLIRTSQANLLYGMILVVPDRVLCFQDVVFH